MSSWWNTAVAAIFAREFLEAAVIINTFLSLIAQSDQSATEQRDSCRTVWLWALISGSIAVVMVSIVGVALHFAGQGLDDRVGDIIEGFSKIVAALCIAQLSIKIPKWFGIWGRAQRKDPSLVAKDNLRFNIAWNIWREIGEIGLFLVPFFLEDDNVSAIWASGLVGIAVAAVFGALLWVYSKCGDTFPLAVFLTVLTGWLATGLFVGGCHELEEVWGETHKMFKINGAFWDHKKLPMTIFKPFGYSKSPTELMVVAFWLFLAALVGFHIYVCCNIKEGSSSEETQTPEEGCTETEQVTDASSGFTVPHKDSKDSRVEAPLTPVSVVVIQPQSDI